MKNKGFTLIELIIAASILGIITSTGVANFIKFNQREKLEAAALKVKTYLRKAQAHALAGVKNEDQCQTRPLDGWCIDLFRGYLYGHCGGPVEGGSNPVDFNVEQFDLPEGVSISFDPSPPEGGILLFKPLGQGVDKNLTVCLSLSGFGKKYKLTVTSSGEITDEGFVNNCP